jgi:hypothetical protein
MSKRKIPSIELLLAAKNKLEESKVDASIIYFQDDFDSSVVKKAQKDKRGKWHISKVEEEGAGEGND